MNDENDDKEPLTKTERYLIDASAEHLRIKKANLRKNGLPATGVDPSTIKWTEPAGKKPLKPRLLTERGNGDEIGRC